MKRHNYLESTLSSSGLLSDATSGFHTIIFWFGLFWGVIQPLLMSAIFHVALNNSVGVGFSHYFLYIYSGFIFWSVFTGGLSQAYISFLNNDGMIKQICFPSFLLPLTFPAAKLMDLLIALALLNLLAKNIGFERKRHHRHHGAA